MRVMQSLFSGPPVETGIAFTDLRSNEKWVTIPITLVMVAIGIAPQFLFSVFNSTVVQMARLFA
jgi:NADH:ubiquinone oxidoreductase subunit 4 (subunit M)